MSYLRDKQALHQDSVKLKNQMTLYILITVLRKFWLILWKSKTDQSEMVIEHLQTYVLLIALLSLQEKNVKLFNNLNKVPTTYGIVQKRLSYWPTPSKESGPVFTNHSQERS